MIAVSAAGISSVCKGRLPALWSHATGISFHGGTPVGIKGTMSVALFYCFGYSSFVWVWVCGGEGWGDGWSLNQVHQIDCCKLTGNECVTSS